MRDRFIRISVGWRFIVFYFFTRSIMVYFGSTSQPQPFLDRLQPFINQFLKNPSLDPWTNWASQGQFGDVFPYGWPILLLVSLSQIIGLTLGSAWAGFVMLVILIELATILCCLALFRDKEEFSDNFVKFTFLFSPVVVVVISIDGSLDFLSMAFLLASLLAVQKREALLSGLFLGLAIGSSPILLVAVVAFIFYERKKASPDKRETRSFYSWLVISLFFSLSPILYSPGFQTAIFAVEEKTWLLNFGMTFSSGEILIVPIVILASWYAIYQLRRMNFELLALAVSTPLLILGTLPGAPIGRTLWAFSIIIYLASSLPSRSLLLTIATINLPVLLSVLNGWEGGVTNPQLWSFALDLTQTSAIATSFILLVILWREHATRADFVRLRSRTALILISGDSGVGKDTLAEALTRALGKESCVRVSGDDYHKWDRSEGAWNFLTHLNPNANDLTSFYNDILTLSQGGEVRHGRYDHRVGRRLSGRTAKSREFVIASGLHALYVEDINRLATLKVFLEMPEDLRTWLKVNRDTLDRGYTKESVMESIRRRQHDSVSFIEPQGENADVRVKVEFSKPAESQTPENPNLRINLTSAPKIFDGQLMSELSLTCGLEVSIHQETPKLRTISIQGSTESSLLSNMFCRMEPRIASTLESSDFCDEGIPGIIQIVLMVYLANHLRQERLVL